MLKKLKSVPVTWLGGHGSFGEPNCCLHVGGSLHEHQSTCILVIPKNDISDGGEGRKLTCLLGSSPAQNRAGELIGNSGGGDSWLGSLIMPKLDWIYEQMEWFTYTYSSDGDNGLLRPL
jgi:hypothetical protein